MPTATQVFEVRKVCGLCGHAVNKVGVMPSGHCGLHGCVAVGWHYHCGERHSSCMDVGCWPKDES